MIRVQLSNKVSSSLLINYNRFYVQYNQKKSGRFYLEAIFSCQPLGAVLLTHPLAVSPTSNALYPGLVGQVPFHGFADAGLKCFLWLPAQVALDLTCVNGIASVVTWSIFNIDNLPA